MSTDASVWVGALLTFATWSFVLLGDNPAFKFAEHLLMGCSAGYAIGLALVNLKTLAFGPLAAGQLVYIAPIALGLLLYSKFIPKLAWFGRIPVGLIVALASGVAARGAIESQILGQIRATMLPLNNMTNIVMVVGVISVLWYFFLSITPSSGVTKGVSRGVARLGRFVMMAAFGASFATTVTARFSNLIGRLTFVLQTWLGIA